MTPNEFLWLLFGIGLGATGSMFATGYYFCKRFEEDEAERVELRRRYS